MNFKLGVCALALMFVGFSVKAEDRIIVKMNQGQELGFVSSAKRVQHLFGQYYVVYSNNLDQVREELAGNKNIERIDQNAKSAKRKLPEAVGIETSIQLEKSSGEKSFNDPKLSKVWAFRTASRGGMSIEAAYENFGPVQNDKIIVAVVDTGVDYNHEDLKDVMWRNPNEIAGNGIDDDGNGYVDDVYGIDTLERDSSGAATGDPMDTHSHGTHVSGTIAATQNNGVGIAGVASNVEIMAIRTVPNNADETDVDVSESFLYAAKHGAKIINCSFGKSNNEGGDLVKDTIEHIGREYGVLVVVAAGNDSSDIDRRLTYPASFDVENMMVVAATSSGGSMSYFSNYGRVNVDLAAPGSSIYSTLPGNRYGNMSGTSMASPNAAGVAAEVLSRHPELSPYQLKEILMDTVTRTSRFESRMVSGGRIDLLTALKSF